MALAIFLRGLNVGGHRSFRPSVLAADMARLEVTNVGATGTFVVRRPVGRRALRAEIARRLPFEAEIVICDGREILDLARLEVLEDQPERPDVVRFVRIHARRPRAMPPLPLELPEGGAWLVRVLASEGRFVLGLHRRHMKVLACFRTLDRILGPRATTRSWGTIRQVAGILRRP